jgi:hypothetical protein
VDARGSNGPSDAFVGYAPLVSRAEISAPDLEPDPDVPAGSRVVPVVAALAGLLCVAVLVMAALRLAGELTRDPTDAERRDAAATEIARRYLTWPAARIFPESLPYTLDIGGDEVAKRAGISPDTRCATAVDPQLAGALAGCRAVLRAVYLDQAQGLAITLGVAAFAEESAARAAAARFSTRRPSPGLRMLAFPGSVAARLSDASRQAAAVRQDGPYIVAATVGYVDGRPAVKGAKQEEGVTALAPQLASAVLKPLITPDRVDCDLREWTC